VHSRAIDKEESQEFPTGESELISTATLDVNMGT
jgi:hypothetical protein